ncbi:beta strand repeat-containing protein [Blastomonas sp. SL216]|uniref:beta strand repeat-containing protein n=1 Tax=Blastomonas sp. SL216 TaxID=2995169 RepID=UPI0023770D17|nr:MBG domain-containing protein [Blastomonas sp. SL216]
MAAGANADSGPGNGNFSSGSVRLFTFTNTSFAGGLLAGTIGRGYFGTGNLDVGASLENFDQFGSSVSLNAAGDRLAVGAISDDGFNNIASSSGSVRLFTFSNTSFANPTLVGIIGRGYTGTGNLDLGTALGNNDQFGISVSLNAAGDRLAVGANGDAGATDATSGVGAVRLFSFGNTSFGSGTLTAIIGKGYTGGSNLDLGTDLEASDGFGRSVSLNALGNRLAVGTPGDDGFGNTATNSGAVRLFTYTANTYTGSGATRVIGRGYTGLGDLDLGTGLEVSDSLGTSVAFNAAGDRLVIGATGDDGFGNAVGAVGSVRLVTFGDAFFGNAALAGVIGSGFTASDISSLDLGGMLDVTDQFGISVALNAAGDRLAVGAPSDDGFGNSVQNAGAVHLFRFTGSSFAGGALAGTIGRGYIGTRNFDVGASLEANDNFGRSVSLNGSGDRLAVGAIGDDGSGNIASGAGSVRLFTFANTSFGGAALASTIGRGYSGTGNLDLGTSLETDDGFGTSVALNASGNRLVVGAIGDDGFQNQLIDSGSVRLFFFTDNNFSGVAHLGTIGYLFNTGSSVNVGTQLQAGDRLGSAVALNASGDRLAVGASGDDGSTNGAAESGAVLLFNFTSTSFGGGTLASIIGRSYTIDPGSALEAGDLLGSSVALNAAGDKLAVGASNDAGASNTVVGAGAVRVYSFSNANFGGASLTNIFGRGYTGTGNFDTTGGALAGIGNAVAFNNDGKSLVLGSPNSSVIAAMRLVTPAEPAVGSLLFADNATGTSNISHTALQTALSTGQAITLEASNDITVSTPFGASNSSGAGGALTLRAGRSILLNGSIITDDGNLTLIANSGGSDLTTVNLNRSTGAAAITMGAGVAINAGSGNVSITIGNGTGLTNSTSGAITLGSITAGSISVTNAGTTAGSDIIVRSGAVLRASGTGRAIDIRAETGTFTNNAGTGAFSLTGGGTYGVFSDAPATTTEGVTGYLKRYNVSNATAFAALNPGGSFFAYRIAPVLTVTADNFTRNYGDANPSFTFGITGFIDGDTAAGSIAGAPAFTTAADLTTAIGTYAITPSLGTLASAEGYQFSFANGSLLVVQRPITVTADALTRIYGEANPALTFTIGGQGLVNGDTVTGSLATTAGLTTNVGSYAITQGSVSAGGNYALTYSGANLTVTARPITVTADALNRIYGDANPAFTFTVGGMGLVNGNTLTGALATTATQASGVGSYAISQGSLSGGSNYALTFNGANLTIDPRSITLTANALSRFYGSSNPTLTYSVGGQGLVNGDTLSGALATTAGLTSNVGSYAITQGSLAASSNYTLTGFTGADLTVTARYRSRLRLTLSPAFMAMRTRRSPTRSAAKAWSTATRSPAR